MFGRKKNPTVETIKAHLQKAEIQRYKDEVEAASGAVEGEQILTAVTGKIDGDRTVVVACESGLVVSTGKGKKQTVRRIPYGDVRHVEFGTPFSGSTLTLQLPDGVVKLEKSLSNLVPQLADMIRTRMG